MAEAKTYSVHGGVSQSNSTDAPIPVNICPVPTNIDANAPTATDEGALAGPDTNVPRNVVMAQLPGQKPMQYHLTVDQSRIPSKQKEQQSLDAGRAVQAQQGELELDAGLAGFETRLKHRSKDQDKVNSCDVLRRGTRSTRARAQRCCAACGKQGLLNRSFTSGQLLCDSCWTANHIKTPAKSQLRAPTANKDRRKTIGPIGSRRGKENSKCSRIGFLPARAQFRNVMPKADDGLMHIAKAKVRIRSCC